MSKVYVKLNERGLVVDVNSSDFLPDLAGWTEVDEGDGKRYRHAQRNYLPKSLYTDEGMPRYKLASGIVTERTPEEIQADIDALPPPPPSTQEIERGAIAAYQALLSNNTISDAVASQHPKLAPEMNYTGKSIPANTRIQWKGEVVKAKVTLWDRIDQDPDHAPTLWDKLRFHNGYRIIPETITAELQFAENEIGYWPVDEKFYRAKRDGVVYTPLQYAADWEEVVP